MKYKLLAVSTVPAINIGDYIQALASSQFYPHIDGFIEREQLKDYDGDPCKVIMNAYYMHNGNQWPPSSKIIPLFVATHINTLVRNSFEKKESIDYLKTFTPIGCRDYETKDFLLQNGVDSYFSGCMTLTLGLKYKYTGKREGVYFVDPKVTFKNKAEKLYYFIKSFTTFNYVKRIGKQWFRHDNLNMSELAIVAKFIFKYRMLFSEETLQNANYITQESSYYNDNFQTADDLLKEAERLVTLYAKAEFVVTSRIHCALPCLGLETPVLFINNKEQAESSSCRLKGLKELFNVLEWSHNGIKACFEMKGKISANNHPDNVDTWKPLAKDLIRKCELFIKEKK